MRRNTSPDRAFPTATRGRTSMNGLQKDFLGCILRRGALEFGDFRLKSGRRSPYFFNFGRFDNGPALLELGELYARAIEQYELPGDQLFGPAYKGIPIAVATAFAMARRGRDLGYCSNRKEVKHHGDSGPGLGQSPRGRHTIILDDVLTSGASARAARDFIRTAGGRPSAVLVGLDRCEKSMGNRPATTALAGATKIPVYSIATVHDLLEYLVGQPRLEAARGCLSAHLRATGCSHRPASTKRPIMLSF